MFKTRPLFLFQSNDDNEGFTGDFVGRAMARSREPDNDVTDEAPSTPPIDTGSEDDSEVVDETTTSEELIFGKYKTLEEAEKAHKEFEQRFHAERQQQALEPDEETEDEYDPWEAIREIELQGFGDPRPRDFAQLGELLQTDPTAAAKFVLENQKIFKPEVINYVVHDQWAKADPKGYVEWKLHWERQALTNEFSQTMGPVVNDYQVREFQKAQERVLELPYYATVQPTMQEIVQANPTMIHIDGLTTADNIFQQVEALYDMALGRYVRNGGVLPSLGEPQEEEEVEETPEPKPPTRKRVVSQTGNNNQDLTGTAAKDKNIASRILHGGER